MTATRILAITLSLCFLSTVQGDEPQADLYKPQDEHKLLQRFDGQWQFTKKSVPADGRSDQVGSGEVSAKMLGDFFVLSQWKGEIYGAKFQAAQTLGFDPRKQRYVGTWADSIMSHQWQLEGRADKSESTLVINSKGPGADGKPTEYREWYRFRSADEIHVRSEMKKDEKWVEFMTTELKRKKTEAKK